MDIPKGIEGDYIETKKDNLFFDIKGIYHPNDRKICFLRFYPHPEGKRIKNDIKYKKVYNLHDRYLILKKLYPEYLFFSKNLDMEIQSVPNNDILKIYTPRNCFETLFEKKNLSTIEKYSKDLCELFINKGKISKESIGITGSIMVGLNKSESDIDLIIYGTEISIQFQEKLKQLFETSKNLRKYTMEEYKSHFTWRAGGSTISFDDFIKSEKRKLHQGKFNEVDFFIRYIKNPKDWGGNFYDFQYTNCGRIKVKALVVDSRDSLFTPCSYKVNIEKILKKDLIPNDIKPKDMLEVNSFRGRFCEQAKEGETVIVQGKLEKVIYKNKVEFYRILLTDQVKDKMIIKN
ncbi:MAG: hypothetical protein ACFFHD_00255 [Promethearchaeota archaeon]